MTAEKRKVEYGIKRAHYAAINATGDGFETPIEMLGARGFTAEVEVEDTPQYADNQVHLVIPGKELTSGELRMYQLVRSFMSHALGRKELQNGMLSNTGNRKPFALMFEGEEYFENGTTQDVISIYYNCLASPPSKDKNTTEGAIEGEELVTTLSINPCNFALDDDDIPVTDVTIYYDEVLTKPFFDNYGTAIYLPQDPAPVPPLPFTAETKTGKNAG